MHALLLLEKDEGVDNVHPKFHIILVISVILDEVVIQMSQNDENNFLENH